MCPSLHDVSFCGVFILGRDVHLKKIAFATLTNSPGSRPCFFLNEGVFHIGCTLVKLPDALRKAFYRPIGHFDSLARWMIPRYWAHRHLCQTSPHFSHLSNIRYNVLIDNNWVSETSPQRKNKLEHADIHERRSPLFLAIGEYTHHQWVHFRRCC